MTSGLLTRSFRVPARVFSFATVYGSQYRAGIVAPTRCFSTQTAVDIQIRKAFDDYMKLRSSEINEYEPTSSSDRTETGSNDSCSSQIDVRVTESFASMGLNGLDEVELVLTIESKLGITLSDEDFHAIHSVADAIRIINKLEQTENRDA